MLHMFRLRGPTATFSTNKLAFFLLQLAAGLAHQQPKRLSFEHVLRHYRAPANKTTTKKARMVLAENGKKIIPGAVSLEVSLERILFPRITNPFRISHPSWVSEHCYVLCMTI